MTDVLNPVSIEGCNFSICRAKLSQCKRASEIETVFVGTTATLEDRADLMLVLTISGFLAICQNAR